MEDHRPNMFSIIRLLLQNGAKTRAGLDVETDLIHRWAMLKHPKMRGHNTLDIQDRKDFEEILTLLLERGLDIDGRDGNGRTPLHSALMAADSRGRSSWGYTDPHNPMLHLRLLLDHGANPSLKDKSGKTPCE
jgi:ankyrin repeat protein